MIVQILAALQEVVADTAFHEAAAATAQRQVFVHSDPSQTMKPKTMRS